MKKIVTSSLKVTVITNGPAMHLIRLRDIKDILRVYSDRGGLIDEIAPSRAITFLKKLKKFAEYQAKAQGLNDNEWFLTAEQTQEYIKTITCSKCVNDEVTKAALFEHQKQIAPLNRVLKELHQLEIYQDEALLVNLAGCNDYHRLAYAFESIRAVRAALSQAENKFIVRHHAVAVSLAKIFIALYRQPYAHSLIMQFMEDLDSSADCMQHLQSYEDYVYSRRDESHNFIRGRSKPSLVECIERLAYNKLVLTNNDLRFLTQHTEIAMSLANIYVMLSTLNIEQVNIEFRKLFTNELKENLLEYEEQSALSVTTFRRVILPRESGGFVNVLRQMCETPGLVTLETLQELIGNLQDCEQYGQAFAEIAASDLPDKQDFINLVALNPQCAQPIVSLLQCLSLLQGYREVANLNLHRVTMAQLKALDNLFSEYLPVELRTAENLKALLATPRAILNVRTLLKAIKKIHALDQECFEQCVTKARHIRGFTGLNGIITSNKIHPDIIYKLMSLGVESAFVVAGMRELIKLDQANLDAEALKLFIEPRLAHNIAATIVIDREEGVGATLDEIVKLVQAEHPKPDMTEKPFPFVLTGLSPSVKRQSFSASLFHISLGDSPTLPRDIIDDEDLSEECKI